VLLAESAIANRGDAGVARGEEVVLDDRAVRHGHAEGHLDLVLVPHPGDVAVEHGDPAVGPVRGDLHPEERGLHEGRRPDRDQVEEESAVRVLVRESGEFGAGDQLVVVAVDLRGGRGGGKNQTGRDGGDAGQFPEPSESTHGSCSRGLPPLGRPGREGSRNLAVAPSRGTDAITICQSITWEHTQRTGVSPNVLRNERPSFSCTAPVRPEPFALVRSICPTIRERGRRPRGPGAP
jgi:hypothetical protein